MNAANAAVDAQVQQVRRWSHNWRVVCSQCGKRCALIAELDDGTKAQVNECWECRFGEKEGEYAK